MSTKPLVISLITLSLISANAFGHTGESDSICKIAEVERDAGVDTSQKLVSGFTVGEIETLTTRICSSENGGAKVVHCSGGIKPSRAA